MKAGTETDNPPPRWLLAYGASAVIVFVGLAAVWTAYPERRDWLSREGGPIEGLTTAFYAAGALISLASIRAVRRRGESPAAYWLLGGLCLLAALDETSYGAGVVPGLTFPVVLGVKLDALHDLVDVGRVALARIGATRLHLSVAAAVVVGAAVVACGRLWARIADVARGSGRFWLVAFAVALGLAAQAMDVLRVSVFLEESLELEAALALVFAAIAGPARARGRADRIDGTTPPANNIRQGAAWFCGPASPSRPHGMKRTLAAVVLLAALGVLLKLALKPLPPPAVEAPAPHGPTLAAEADPEAELRTRYTAPADRALVERTLQKYRQTALAIERTDGLRGLALLDRLDLEAIFLYEKHPDEFRRLRETLTDDAAADLLLHWREYFGLKRSDDTDRALLVAEIARLTPAQRRAAAKYPSALPLILAEPSGVTDLIERAEDTPAELADALAVLDFISLEPGAADPRAALRTFDDHGPLALDAFRLQGLDGFALVVLYGPVLEALGDGLPLDQALILLRVNSDYVDELLRAHEPETVARHLRHVGARGLVESVGGSPSALRLVVEHAERGEQALAQAGPDAADVVYGDYADATLRNQAVAALAEHGPMALAMLEKYATDPDFRDVLRTWGAAAIPPIARADTGPEALAALRAKPRRSFAETLALSVLFVSGGSGQATIRMIRKDGLDRVSALDSTDVAYYQFLPLYDLLHLGNVLRRGQTPTTGETVWALIDGCFVVADALSLLVVQPEGAAAAEAAHSELKTATQAAVKAAGHALAGEGAGLATERLAKWWAVRSAGGTYQVLRRLPDALGRLSLPEAAQLARPLATKAGLRLSTWAPLRFVRDGKELLLRVPAERGLKYVAAQGVQAGVGVIAYHKMEEHLASRRPGSR